MTLDPALARHLEDVASLGLPPYEELESAEECRAVYRKAAEARLAGRPAAGPPCSVEGVLVDGLWKRIYRPIEHSAFDGPLPLVLFFHGGGWVVGDLDTHDVMARAFVSLPAVVVSCEYRLAPEHPYPAAHDDCWDALLWAVSGAGDWYDVDRVIVAGDSAGGLLAASVAARARDTEGAPSLAAQVLVYPAMEPAMDSASHSENAEGYGLTSSTMRWYYDQYQPGEGFSPSTMEDLSGLPPAVVVTAGYDPLKDDGLHYAERLRRAGVPVADLCFDGLIHGFFGMGNLSRAAQAAVDATVGALRGLLA